MSVRSPFNEIDGHPGKSQFYRDYMQDYQSQIESRFLSRILQFGVTQGMVITDGTTGLVTGVNITSGVAYDSLGKRTILSGDLFHAVTNADEGKYLVITRTQVSGFAEAHPFSGVTGYTRIDDSSVVSAVVTPDSDAGQIRLALIETVDVFPTGVGTREIDLIDRDNLLVSSPFPYVTIGDSTATDVDFSGDDEQPFIDALEALSAVSGGIIFVKKPRAGTAYDIAVAGGIIVSGFDTVRFIGEGFGTTIKSPNGVAGQFVVADCGEVSFEGFSFMKTGSDSGHLTVRDTGIISFQNCYVSGKVNQMAAIDLVSGIDHVLIKDNIFHGANQAAGLYPWRTTGFKPRNTIGSIIFENNLCSAGVRLEMSWHVKDMIIRNNFFENGGWNEGAYNGPLGDINLDTPPKNLIVENNIWPGGGSTNYCATSATGAIIKCNSMKLISTVGITLQNNTGTSGYLGNYSVIDSNVIFHRRSGVTNAIEIASASTSGVLIGGNVLVSDGSHSSQGGIKNVGEHTIIDDNIASNFSGGLGIVNTGGNTFFGITDKTTNQKVTG